MRIIEGFFEEELPLNAIIGLGEPEAAASRLGVVLPESLKNAVLKRKFEFVAGRACAARALKRAGFTGQAGLAILPDRSTEWPNGFIGSIAHSDGIAWAVVAPKANARGVGIDLERIIEAKTASEISEKILRDEEKASERMKGLSHEQYLSLVFSAKESLYKCLAPMTGQFFGFEDAECVRLDLENHELILELRKTLNEEFQAGFRISARIELNETGVRTFVAVRTDA